MAIIQNWKIRSRAKRCSQTGEPFSEGDVIHTCIFIDLESDGYLRKDYSEAGWREVSSKDKPFSHWKANFEIPEIEPDRPGRMDQDEAEVLLQQLMDEDDPATEKARYILVVMMERKKLLKQVGERQSDERRLLIYEHSKSGEVVIVPDPQIRLEEVPAVQEEVTALLDRLGSPSGDEESEDDTDSD